MHTFLRLVFIWLFLGVFFTSPAFAHDFQKVEGTQFVHELSISPASTQDLGFTSLLETPLLPQKPSVSNKAVKDDQKDSKFVPLISQRLISFAQHDPLQNEPDYRLAFEFAPPLALSLTIGYRIDFAQSLDWSLHMGKKPSRLSGWKETNLLYRFHKQAHLVKFL